MAVRFYMDVHVPQAITDQLRNRDVEVLTAAEDGAARFEDQELLERGRNLGRVIFTQDIGFRVRAENWQQQGRTFAGLIFGHPLRGSIGQYVRDLELIAHASEPSEWQNVVVHLPL